MNDRFHEIIGHIRLRAFICVLVFAHGARLTTDATEAVFGTGLFRQPIRTLRNENPKRFMHSLKSFTGQIACKYDLKRFSINEANYTSFDQLVKPSESIPVIPFSNDKIVIANRLKDNLNFPYQINILNYSLV